MCFRRFGRRQHHDIGLRERGIELRRREGALGERRIGLAGASDRPDAHAERARRRSATARPTAPKPTSTAVWPSSSRGRALPSQISCCAQRC